MQSLGVGVRGLAQHNSLDFRSSHIVYLDCGFNFFYFHLYLGKISNLTIFPDGLKPPTSYGVGGGATAHVNCRVLYTQLATMESWNKDGTSCCVRNVLNMMILLRSSQWQGYHQQYR